MLRAPTLQFSSAARQSEAATFPNRYSREHRSVQVEVLWRDLHMKTKNRPPKCAKDWEIDMQRINLKSLFCFLIFHRIAAYLRTFPQRAVVEGDILKIKSNSWIHLRNKAFEVSSFSSVYYSNGNSMDLFFYTYSIASRPHDSWSSSSSAVDPEINFTSAVACRYFGDLLFDLLLLLLFWNCWIKWIWIQQPALLLLSPTSSTKPVLLRHPSLRDHHQHYDLPYK